MNRKKDTTNLPLNARLFEDLSHFRDFASQKHYFSSWLLFFFFRNCKQFLLFIFPRPSLAQSRRVKWTLSKLWFFRSDSSVNRARFGDLFLFKHLLVSFSPFSYLQTILLNVFSRPSLPCSEEKLSAQSLNARPLRCDLKSLFRLLFFLCSFK